MAMTIATLRTMNMHAVTIQTAAREKLKKENRLASY